MSDRRKLPVRRRGMKVNPKQKKILMQFMADNPTIYYHRITPDFTLEHHYKFWQNMSNVLNIFGPPRKTVDSWKKAWKDMKLRYRKAGIDMKQIINTLKSENVVNTRALLDSVEKLNSNKETIEVEHLWREHRLDNSPGESPDMSPNLNDADDSPRGKIDLSKTLDMAAELGLTGLEQKLRMAVESKNEVDDKIVSDDDCEELYLAVEEVVESDYECTNDSSIQEKSNNITESKVLLKNIETDSHVVEQNLKAHEVLRKEEKICGSSEANKLAENSKNKAKKNFLNEVLVELRILNKVEKEKLALKKNFIEYQKLMMQHTLTVQKEMAKAQASLANTIRRKYRAYVGCKNDLKIIVELITKYDS